MKILILWLLAIFTAASADSLPAPVLIEKPADPARLNLARSIAAKLISDGTFERLTHEGLTEGIKSIDTEILYAPLMPIIQKLGLNQAQIASLPPRWLPKAMAILDQRWQERVTLGLPAINAAVAQVLGQHEPKLRENLARSFASRLNLEQLSDLDKFLSSPSGNAYANQAAALQPYSLLAAAILANSQEIRVSMPAIQAKFAAATSSLPRQKTLFDLSNTERGQLADALDVNAASLRP